MNPPAEAQAALRAGSSADSFYFLDDDDDGDLSRWITSLGPVDTRRFGVRKLLVKGRIERGENMNKSLLPLGSRTSSHSAPWLFPAYSPFEDLLKHGVMAAVLVV